jgi:hypothetical protein
MVNGQGACSTLRTSGVATVLALLRRKNEALMVAARYRLASSDLQVECFITTV